jgi:hypothetical protein
VAGDRISATASVPAVVGSTRVGLSPWVLALLVPLAAGASGYLSARWAAERLRSELTLRPPVILFDMAGAVNGVDPAQLGASVARAKKQAKRLSEGGLLVLDAQAVIAAPPELFLAADGDAAQMTR